MGLVLLAVFVVQSEHDLLIRVKLLGVFFRVTHTVFRRELAAVDVALIRIEPENLMVHYRVLRLLEFTGLLIADAAGGLVEMCIRDRGHRHTGL